MGNKILSCIATLLLTAGAPALGYGEWLFPATDLANVNAATGSNYVVIDSLGNGIATFGDSTTNAVYERRYIRASRSFDATITQITPAGQTVGGTTFSIAMNGLGNAVAAWRNQTLSAIQARFYNAPTTSWLTTSTLFIGNTGGVNASSIAINTANNAIAIWRNFVTGKSFIQSSYYNGSSWDTTTIISGLVNDTTNPHIVIDDASNGIAVWTVYNGGNNLIETRRYISGSGWDPAGTTTLSAPGQDAYDPQVAANGAGNAFAIWNRYDGTNYRIEVVRYTPGGGWDIANTATLSAAGQDMDYPQIAMDPAGNAIAVWQNDTTGLIQTSRYNVGTNTWSPAINLTATGVSTFPRIGMDAAGNGIAVWQQFTGGLRSFQASYYKKITNSWGTITTLSVPTANNVGDEYIAMSSSGSALANWTLFTGSLWLPQAIYFDADPALPICLKCYLLTQEYILNKLAQP